MTAAGAPVVLFERFGGGYASTPTLENASARAVVMKDCCNTSGRFAGKGDVFLEDVCSNPSSDWRFAGKNVWARQLNIENEGLHCVNDGARLWVLGLKTERGGTLLTTRGGGMTEVLGGLCYTTTDPKDAPMFAVEDGVLRVTLGESCFTGRPYENLVRDLKGRAPELKRAAAPSRTGGSVLPLYISSPVKR